jgi:hypothetical protein
VVQDSTGNENVLSPDLQGWEVQILEEGTGDSILEVKEMMTAFSDFGFLMQPDADGRFAAFPAVFPARGAELHAPALGQLLRYTGTVHVP